MNMVRFLAQVAATVTVLASLPLSMPLAGADMTYYEFGRCYDSSHLIDLKPSQIFYGCDGTGILEAMTWTTYGPDEADGTGIDDTTDCVPSCADGHRYTNPVVVHAWNPRPAGCRTNLLFWYDFDIAYPKGVPPGLDGPNSVDAEFTHYNGMPAVHYFNQKPMSCGITG